MVLDERHSAAGERSGEADANHRGAEPRGMRQRRLQPRQCVGTGGDHRRRMQQRRDGRGPCHCREQPWGKWELAGFGGRGDEHSRGDNIEVGAAQPAQGVEAKRASARESGPRGEEQPEVAEAGGDERLPGRLHVGPLPPVEADQGPRHEPDELPADQEGEQVTGQHEQFHGADERGELADEAGEAVLVFVVRGVGDDRQSDDGHQDRHHPGQPVGSERELEACAPAECSIRAGAHRPSRDRQGRQNCRRRGHRESGPPDPAPREPDGAAGRCGEHRDEPDHSLSRRSFSVMSALRVR